MKPAVVLDKNFLQGSPVSVVRALAESHTLVMPGALFFELLTTDIDARRKCFSKLPQSINPVDLVDHMGVLLKHEGRNNAPCGKPSTHRMSIDFQFNARLVEEDYTLPAEAQATIDSQIHDANADVERLIGLSESVPSLFPVLASPRATKSSPPHREAEALISNAQAVKEFYETLDAPDVSHTYPRISGAPEDWAHIRHLQVLMLFAVDIHVRYGGKIRSLLSPNVLLKLEHDVHDAQILALAILEGAIATNEKKLVRWFKLLTPGGAVHSE